MLAYSLNNWMCSYQISSWKKYKCSETLLATKLWVRIQGYHLSMYVSRREGSEKLHFYNFHWDFPPNKTLEITAKHFGDCEVWNGVICWPLGPLGQHIWSKYSTKYHVNHILWSSFRISSKQIWYLTWRVKFYQYSYPK